jgi:hypothetical protein
LRLEAGNGAAVPTGIALCLLLCGRPLAAGTPAVYTFDPRADRLLEVFFPSRVLAERLAAAYVTRNAPAAFANLDDVYRRNLSAPDHGVDEPSWIDVGEATDSYWLSGSRDEDHLRRFWAVATQDVVDLVDGLARSPLRFGSVVEKALFQRDAWQIFSLCSDLRALELAGAEAARRAALLDALGRLVLRLRLDEREYQALLAVRTQADPRRFPESSSWDLAEDYLPRRVLATSPGWFSLPFVEEASRHFRIFRGRSFIHVYVKPPGMTAWDFYRYWDRLNRRFGSDIHLRTGKPPLPARTELMLVRTFGMFLADGSYVDSTFPEEVLLRMYKHQLPQLDMATSDYRGALLYQYKLSRRDLLGSPSRLGLRRIREDDAQFVGFFAEAPDPYHSSSDAITTMRFNCILCHSEYQYGVGTVFSMTRPPVFPSAPVSGVLQDGMLEVLGSGRYRLCTEEARQLSAFAAADGLRPWTSSGERDGGGCRAARASE